MSTKASTSWNTGVPVNRRILAVDDNRDIHADYRKVLLGRQRNSQLAEAESFLFDNAPPKTTVVPDYQIDSAFQGKQGLELVQAALDANAPYSVAFIDVRMPPGWDGIETAKRIWEIAPSLPIVLCTAYSDHSWEEISNELDRTDQLLILKKPFDAVELQQVAASQSARWQLNQIAEQKREHLEEMVEARTHEIALTRDLVFSTLAKLAESRDPETGYHLERIEKYTQLLAEYLADHSCYADQLSKSFVKTIVRSSILHDIGKVGIPDHVLLKPGRLTPDEFEIMKQHVTIGANALDEAAAKSTCSSFLEVAASIARYHHERFDGSGYPLGIHGEQIPLSARIVAVADVFDALTSQRIYKDAMPLLDAKELINSESGCHFDPVIVTAFNACWDDFCTFAQSNRFRDAKLPSNANPPINNGKLIHQ